MENIKFSEITNTKNLLAFSAGIDSTALFFLLKNADINFDLAIVNYNIREEAKQEIQYAKELAKKFDKKLFIKNVTLTKISNFEKQARDIRYNFFEKIIQEESYNVLITAHQLNDKLEWFLMQLTKGSGLIELIGFNKIEKKDFYTIYKPLLTISKDELENFLIKNKQKYFIDKTNLEQKYKRNYFRHNFTDKLIDEFKNGIKNSFDYLDEDLNSLEYKPKVILKIKDLEIFEKLSNDNLNIRLIDKSLKKRGLLISKESRKEILRQKKIIISHKISINIEEKYIWIAPNVINVTMNKKFKEACRINKIPKNIRTYIFIEKINPKELVI